MLHALILLFLLLFAPLAMAQPPAPAGGDMSNTTTLATGSVSKRLLKDRAADWLNPKDFGAVGDATSRPLTAGAPLLASCPQLAAPVETDACALQAALNQISARGAAVANVVGTPGGTIRIPAGTTLKLGTQSLSFNNASAAIVGEDQMTSAILVGAYPMLNFGLNNGMGIGAAVIASSGAGFIVGDILTVSGLGGNCIVRPVITVTSVGPSGEILGHTITTPGNCPATPSNPLDYSTSGNGYGAQYNGVWTSGALTNAIQISGTGTGCINGEILTGTGGSTPGGTPRQFQLVVTNAVGGIIQAGGVGIIDTGRYGTPPANPVPVTGSLACVGAQFNVSKFSNSGGALVLSKLHLTADAPGASIVNAQFNLVAHTNSFEDLTIDTVQGSPNYWNGQFTLKSSSVGSFRRIDVRNNLSQFNSHPSDPAFIMTAQNNLLGAYDYNFDQVSIAYQMGGAIQFLIGPGDPGFQALGFHHVECGVSAHCIQLTNTGSHAYGKVVIDDLYAGQSVQAAEITLAQNVIITNSGFQAGVTRVASPPAQADFVSLNNVNQWTFRGNVCATAVALTPSVTCVHLKGTTAFGIASNNIMSNSAKLPTMNGYVFDSGTSSNLQINDSFIGAPSGMTAVVDNGTGNTTLNTPPPQIPCLSVGLAVGQTFTIPDYTQCVNLTNSLIANATLVLPLNYATNQVINFTAFSGITSLTLQVQAGSGQVLGGGMPSTITNALPFSLKNITFRWQRV